MAGIFTNHYRSLEFRIRTPQDDDSDADYFCNFKIIDWQRKCQ